VKLVILWKNVFCFSGTEYYVVDTVGIGNTNQTTREVLSTVINKMRSMSGGISQILLVADGRFLKEIEIQSIERYVQK
jgi:hypothetical protein